MSGLRRPHRRCECQAPVRRVPMITRFMSCSFCFATPICGLKKFLQPLVGKILKQFLNTVLIQFSSLNELTSKMLDELPATLKYLASLFIRFAQVSVHPLTIVFEQKLA